MTTEGKVWGTTEKILDNPFCSFHVLNIHKGGVCSKHLHNFRSNGFYVIQGKLLIRTWKDDNVVDRTIVTSHQWTQIPPGNYHQFEALTDTYAIEVYWPEQCSQSDIKRETQGYKKQPTEEELKKQQETLWTRTYC